MNLLMKNNNFTIPIICLVVLLEVTLLIGAFSVGRLTAPKENPVGISMSEYSYASATNASTTCKNGVSTPLLASSTARTSVTISLVGATSTYLCRGETCLAVTGITLTSSYPAFIQQDAYTGSYSCIGTSTSTITISYSP